MSVSRKVLRRFKEGPDREVHLSRLRIGDNEFIEFRTYAPSIKRYGRGIPLTYETFRRIVEEDGPEIVDFLHPKGVAGAGQQALL